jgi:hypothetical protein
VSSEYSPQESDPIWTPLLRSEVEALIVEGAYTSLHLRLLSWLIWCSLLSGEELLRLLSGEEQSREKTKDALSRELRTMKRLGLIDSVLMREPGQSREQRYYATDLGLYLYLSAVHLSPPLSPSRLARSYPVTRDDLVARLARPQVHLALAELVTRLIAEGASLGYHLISYQQPWKERLTLGQQRLVLSSDAALLIQQEADASYAFLVHVDSNQQADRRREHMLLTLLDARQTMLLYRQSWPELLILSSPEQLPLWAHLLLESGIQRASRSLAGGITTFEALSRGVYTPIWYDLPSLANESEPELLSFSHLLREPASMELVEQFSRRRYFFEILLKDAAAPPPRSKERLSRYVGNSLQEEAAQVTREQLEAYFMDKRKTRQSIYGTGLLTLALSAQEKQILTWGAHHPLLDLLTLQALLHPKVEAPAIKSLQHTITHLFQLGLIEVRLWQHGKTAFEQERYLLTDVALKSIATWQGEPYSSYFVLPKYYEPGDDEQIKRQWGTKGLVAQLPHTHGLYTLMRQLLRGSNVRAETLVHWKSAHEVARWYRDAIWQNVAQARPDAEVAFTSADGHTTTILLEYDRATESEQGYTRKFRAYLDYQLATGVDLPLLVVVTPSQKARERIQRVLADLDGSLQVVVLLERDLLAHGFTLALHPPEKTEHDDSPHL